MNLVGSHVWNSVSGSGGPSSKREGCKRAGKGADNLGNCHARAFGRHWARAAEWPVVKHGEFGLHLSRCLLGEITGDPRDHHRGPYCWSLQQFLS